MSWPAEAIWQSISPALPDFSVEILSQIDSTNSELMRRARAGRVEPVLLVAEHQTAGRGRLGRQWHSQAAGSRSEPPASLTFSLALPLMPRNWSGLSLVAGLVVAEALHADVGLKWPNDLWWQDRKLGGILVETAAMDLKPGPFMAAADEPRGLTAAVASGAAVDGALRYVVIGVGLNVTPAAVAALSAQELPLRTPAASLQELLADIDAPAVLARIAAPLVFATLAFASEGFVPWRARFEARDVLRGRAVEMSDGAAQGVADGVDDAGGLLVRTAGQDGVKVVQSAEASVRPRTAG